MNSDETWRVYAELPQYSVSSAGRVKNNTTEKILKPYYNNWGYLLITLCRRRYKIHRLVAGLFCDKSAGCDVVNHINGIKTDNRFENLEWTTPHGNTQNAIDRGVLIGSVAKLTPAQSLEALRIRRESGQPIWKIAQLFGVARSSIYRAHLRAIEVLNQRAVELSS